MKVSLIRTVSWICMGIVAILGGVAVEADEAQLYGKALSGKDTIAIPELLAHPDGFVGKTVRVEGTVTDVCRMAGCWMKLADGDAEIRIKVDDGVIVFPAEAKGRHAVAEGVLVKIEMTLEQTLSHLAHFAEEQGEEFDASQVTEPMTYYQIKGSGAVIR